MEGGGGKSIAAAAPFSDLHGFRVMQPFIVSSLMSPTKLGDAPVTVIMLFSAH